MASKLNKNKEYYLDGRTSTAKKGRKNRHNETKTPISNSVSYNHHKYDEKEGTLQLAVNSKTKPVSGRQMKMMMRCL